MIIYVVCWPLLAAIAGELIPGIGEGDLQKVLKLISLALGIFLIQKLAQFAQDILLAKPALFISQELRMDIFSRVQRVDLLSLESFSSGDITYRLTEDADRVGEIIYKTVQDTVPCLLQLIAVFGYMIYLDVKLSIATLLLAPAVTLLVSIFGSKVMIAAENSQKQVSALAGLLGEAIQGLPLVRAFAAESWLEGKFYKEIQAHRNARYKTLKLLALQHPVVGFIEVTGILAVLAFGAARIQTGELGAKEFSSYVAALLMLIDPISHLTTNFNEMKQGQASLNRLIALQDEPIEQEDPPNPIILKNPIGEISFKNVSFSYLGTQNDINSVDIEISKGQIVALVGPSGAGKSTLFSLLLRFIKPLTGEILFDGNNINELAKRSLREQIALVPQRANVFSGTVEEAISIGRVASREQIIHAAKLANAHNFILDMPSKYDTQLEERGANISGGQLQRIAIARAILGNPSVLLLDEATSALDAEAEGAVQLGLKQAMQGRTVLVIAHRLSTVQEADNIIVLEKGQICDSGTHDELIRRDGRYKELCEKQLIRKIERSDNLMNSR